jgi:hypothetical protein
MKNREHYLQGIRDYADWLEAHPEIDSHGSEICIYGNSDKQARAAFKAGAALDPCNGHDIVYLAFKFGPLVVKHVVKKSIFMAPTIVNGEVVWVPKPEMMAA